MLDVGKYAPANRPELVYQALLDTGVFALPRCGSCARHHFPPRVMCPFCGADDIGWVECSGWGTVYSVSVLVPRGADPYVVVLVDVDEGVRMMSNVVGGSPQDVAIGDRVRVRIEDRDGAALPLFEGVSSNGS